VAVFKPKPLDLDDNGHALAAAGAGRHDMEVRLAQLERAVAELQSERGSAGVSRRKSKDDRHKRWRSRNRDLLVAFMLLWRGSSQ
jgi:hypothetical protein